MTQELKNAYILIGEANDLTYVRDNIFINKFGIEFYLDSYGFHTVIRYNNVKVTKLIDKLHQYNRSMKNVSTYGDILGKKSKNKIRQILSTKELSTNEKIKLIWEYIDIPVQETNNILKGVTVIENEYKSNP